MYTQSNVVNTVGWRRRRARHCWRRPTGAPVPYSMPARSRNAAARNPSLWGTARSPVPGAGGARTLARGARRSALPAPRRLAGHLPRAPTVASAGALVQSRRRAACANPAVSLHAGPAPLPGATMADSPLPVKPPPAPAGRPRFPPYIIGPGAPPRYRKLRAPLPLSAGPESPPGQPPSRPPVPELGHMLPAGLTLIEHQRHDRRQVRRAPPMIPVRRAAKRRRRRAVVGGQRVAPPRARPGSPVPRSRPARRRHRMETP